jgi:hypothetical protein
MRLPSSPNAARVAAAFLFAVAVLLSSRSASAYPWMVRHEYTACVQCHVDPDGAGLLTEYGRAQGETLLRTHYGPTSPDQEAGKAKDFLWGLVPTPEWLLLGGSFRPALIGDKSGSAPLLTTGLLMEADLRAGVKVGGFRASASAGAVSTSGSLASIAGPFVSREHWAGYAWDDDAFLVRAGRMNVPFGIRTIEHPRWVRARQTTRVDIDDGQEHGVAFDYTGSLLRGSIMGILGNYQISPDAFRDRGYAGYLEIAPYSRLSIGVSSLVTHAQKDINLGVADTRQLHGLYVRASPVQPLVLMAEGDVMVNSATASPFPAGAPGAPSSTPSASSVGFVSMLQADVEPIQGVHLIATGETLSPGGVSPQSSFGIWGAVHWFFAPHADVRFDAAYHSLAAGAQAPPGTPGGPPAGTPVPTTIPDTSFVVQLHVYL